MLTDVKYAIWMLLPLMLLMTIPAAHKSFQDSGLALQ